MDIKNFFKKAFGDMKQSAKAQHEVDKAQFAAVKAESRANFEENRGHNSFARAKAQGRQSWEDAKKSPAERAAQEQAAREAKIAAAKKATEEANARYEAARKK